MAVISSVVGAVAAVATGAMASKTAGKNRKTSRNINKQNLDENKRQYDQTRDDHEPWRQAGINAMNNISDPGANFEASPDYEFRRYEGLRTNDNNFAMQGGGGNAMRGAINFSSNLASGEFNNWFQRQFQIGEAGRGATGTVAQAGENRSSRNQSSRNNMGNQLTASRNSENEQVTNAMNSGISNILYANSFGGFSTPSV